MVLRCWEFSLETDGQLRSYLSKAHTDIHSHLHECICSSFILQPTGDKRELINHRADETKRNETNLFTFSLTKS